MKIAGSWASLLRGVSQQAPEQRQPGQHAEQVNMLADPVGGLTRRPGSIMLTEAAAGTVVSSDGATAFASGYRRVDVTTGGVEYAVLLQDREPDAAYVAGSTVLPPAVVCYNLTANAFVPLSPDAVTTAAVQVIGRTGVGAAVALGKHVVYAPHGHTLVPTTTTPWAASTDKVVWVRGGASDKTYRITLGSGATFSYSTPPVFIGGAVLIPTVSTGGVVVAVRVAAGGRGYAPGQKVVFVGTGSETVVATGTILTGADGAVTGVTITNGGVGYAAVSCAIETPATGPATHPEYIAEQLRLGAVAIGLACTRNGTHLLITGSTDVFTATDGGDGSLLRVIGKDSDSVDKLPVMARAGHVVKVTTGPDAYFYLQAIPKGVAFGEVVWRESAGEAQGVGASVPILTIHAGRVYVGPSATIAVPAAPQVVPSAAGDTVVNPAPAWMRGRPITYLGVFQDRLVVVAGAAVTVSAAGDYLNFFRSSMVTVPLKDPFEMLAQGGEDDTIRHGVLYNRNLVLFGDKRQYAVSGSTALTPTSANLSVMTAYADAATVPPVAAGGQIYYARDREGNVGVHQIQPGVFVDSAESFPASAQISDYIPAPVRELVVVAGAPSLLLVRARDTPRSVYTFSFLDTQDGRKQDAWGRWDFAPECGHLLTLRPTPAGVLHLWWRYHAVTGFGWLVADILPTVPVATRPSLDSMRAHSAVVVGTGAVTLASGAAWSVVLDKTTPRFLLGVALPHADELRVDYPTAYPTAITGLNFASRVELTNPVLRDNGGTVVHGGRFVITRVTVGLRASAGVVATVAHAAGTVTLTYNGRQVGSLDNIIGQVPITTGAQDIAIGRAAAEFTLTLSARSWLPLTITTAGWVGQSFNRTARA